MSQAHEDFAFTLYSPSEPHCTSRGRELGAGCTTRHAALSTPGAAIHAALSPPGAAIHAALSTPGAAIHAALSTPGGGYLRQVRLSWQKWIAAGSSRLSFSSDRLKVVRSSIIPSRGASPSSISTVQ